MMLRRPTKSLLLELSVESALGNLSKYNLAYLYILKSIGYKEPFVHEKTISLKRSEYIAKLYKAVAEEGPLGPPFIERWKSLIV
jgi:hypothetical protein